ncbi:MAG: glycoside hydrolase family 28 protein [Phycisphaerae bacterium]
MNTKKTTSLALIVAVGLIASVPLATFSQERPDPNAAPQIPLPVIPAAVFTITDYGAVGDGKTLNTAAIQKAIDAATKAGGGTVVVPPGRFLTGAFDLASGIGLELKKDAVLAMDNNINRFPTNRDGFIMARDANDIKISGKGIIDGQGEIWWEALREGEFINRPQLISLIGCTRVELQGVLFQHSPKFHIFLRACQDVTVHEITIRAPEFSPNTDGLDLSGWNYLITHCTFDVGDDCIALKPNSHYGLAPSCKDITVTQCTFLHGHGLSIGSGSDGGVENLQVSDCSFNGTKSGIRIKTYRGGGGLLNHLVYKNITMTNVQRPLELVDYYPRLPFNPATDKAQPVTDTTPVFKDVTFSHLTVNGGEVAIIWGLPEMPISDILLDHVRIATQGGMEVVNVRNIRFVNSSVTAGSGGPISAYNAEVTGLPTVPLQQRRFMR